MKNCFIIVSLLLSLPGTSVAAPATESPLPLPTEAELAAAPNQPIPKTETHPEEWANPGSLGPTGLVAQRCMLRLEYRILAVEPGSPAAGRMLPGDVVAGIGGQLFQPEDYSAEHPSVAKYNQFMEPNVALGDALEAAAKDGGRLVLTVRRKTGLGSVALQLPSRRSLSETYPWNCPKSEQVAEELAARFATQPLPYQKDLYATAWYGLFLLNHDPEKYRSKIDQIVDLVMAKLPEIRSGSQLRGYGGGTWVWHTSLFGTFLAEYAMITNQRDKMRPHLNLLVAHLFDVRMVGNLWGHTKWHNYGRTSGGFVAASSQAGLALLCMREAGAAIDDSAMAKVLDSLSSSINRNTGQVAYGSPDDGSAGADLNWSSILAEKSQLGVESLMRQGAVQLAMQLDGRTGEALACSHFMERMILSHATHGITPDWGLLDASRAFAASDPAACRKLLDAVRYRLNLCLRWDGGLQLVPYRNRRGEEYGVDTFHADRYAPAMWGLVLSMPKKRLYLLSKTLAPDSTADLPRTSTPPIDGSLSVRHLTCGGGKAYFVAHDGTEEWGVYQKEFKNGGIRLLQGGFRQAPHELVLWENKLIFSVPGASLWAWDGNQARELMKIRARGSKAAAQFTPFKGELFFVSPPSSKKALGGELWKTNGTKAGTVKVRDGLWTLLGGGSSWQSDVGHARSLQSALGRLFFVTCETEPAGKPLFDTFSLWTSDGTAGGTTKLATKKLQVVAVDNNNSPRGSYLGMECGGKLLFCADNKLWESDGTAAGTRESPLNIRTPNNFSRFENMLLLSGRPGKGKGKAARLQIFLTNGTSQATHSFPPGFQRLHQITSVGDQRFFFIANDGRHGDELWVSEGGPADTRVVRELYPGAHGGIIGNLVALGDELYFTATDPEQGTELWRSDGTPEGTTIADLVPGPAGSLPDHLQAADDLLYFYTTATARDRQLWRLDPERAASAFKRPEEVR